MLFSQSYSEVFYKRIGPGWGKISGAKSERNLDAAALSQPLAHLVTQTARSLKGWREKFPQTKRGEHRVCCKSEANELAESKPGGQRPQKQKAAYGVLWFWFSVDRPI